jgi:methionyl-tRNA formyltransferase
VTLIRAQPGPTRFADQPGTITDDGSILAGDGESVVILELQPEGKRPMRMQDFRNGRPWRAGMKLTVPTS